MNSIESNFVPYQIALDMKSIGFDKVCFMFYWGKHKGKLIKTSLMNHIGKAKNNSDLIFDSNNTALGLKDSIFCSAPLYQQAFRWFREKYGLIGFISFNEKSTFRIETLPHSNIKLNSYKEKYFDNNGKMWNTYEEAELECLKKLIEIVKTK